MAEAKLSNDETRRLTQALFAASSIGGDLDLTRVMEILEDHGVIASAQEAMDESSG